jgi:hypothetical protein
VVFTDGAKYVADYGGAYWLLDAIAILPSEYRPRRGRGEGGPFFIQHQTSAAH